MMKTKFQRWFCLIAAGLCMASAVWAQPMDAKSVLDQASARFRQAGGVEAAFTIYSEEGLFEGTIQVKGDKFVLETGNVKVWFDGHTQWTYLSSTDEVNISIPTSEELQQLNPYALLAIYKQGYALALGKTETLQGKAVYEVILTAKDPQTEWQRVAIWVTRDTFRPLQLSTTLQGGYDTATIVISRYQTGLAFAGSHFVFDAKAYPTAEVVDLR